MIKVLIINHDEELMVLLKRYLERDCYKADFTGNLNDVVIHATKFHPDVFLIDAPQQGCIRKLKYNQALSSIPILMMTGQTTSAGDIPPDVNDTIEKPFEGDRLKEKIKSLVNLFIKN